MVGLVKATKLPLEHPTYLEPSHLVTKLDYAPEYLDIS
jgi:hypothetical protein